MTVVRFPDLGAVGRVEFFREETSAVTDAEARVVTATAAVGRSHPPFAIVAAIASSDGEQFEEIQRWRLTGDAGADARSRAAAAQAAEIAVKTLNALFAITEEREALEGAAAVE